MCILSLVKNKNKTIFTFSRDENPARNSTEPYWINSEVFMPIDLLQNGTWIGFNKNFVASLQNGGKIKHKRKDKYDLSRGLILKNILLGVENIHDLNFKNIEVEPFTLTILNLNENKINSIWYDGDKLHHENIEFEKYYFNTSCTLYTEELHQILNNEFSKIDFLEENILNFHKKIKIGSEINPLRKIVETVSITQFIIENKTINSTFLDLKSQKENKI